MSTISDNLSLIQREIAPYKPRIVAVTKYFDEQYMIKAYEAGIRDFGENRVQDALEKIENLPDDIRKQVNFHLIGHLQSNKVKKTVGIFDLIHSVDSVKLAEVISNESASIGIKQKILLQINNADEVSKFGFSKDEIEDAFCKIKNLDGVDIQGLMTIAPLSNDEKYLKKLFQEIIQIKDTIETKFGYNLKEISMGMSNDYKIAACNGSTILRVGRKLFS